MKTKTIIKTSVIGLLLVGLFALAGVKASAQVTVSYAMDTPTFTLSHEDTDKYQVLDTCYLTINYRFQYRATEADDSLSFDDLMELQMGRRYNAFFSRNLRDLDMENTESLKTTMQFSTVPENCVGFDLLFSHPDSRLTVTNRLPYTSQVIEYTEDTPAIEWTYDSEETGTVMGYTCKVATCSYGGRNWKVWYTDTIALPYGPWLLNGAKGIVLKALDTENNFIFTAEGLTQKPQPIIRYEWSRKIMGKAEWKRFERDMYENAGAFVRNTGARILIMDNSEQGYHRLTEDWQQFYNPLEK